MKCWVGRLTLHDIKFILLAGFAQPQDLRSPAPTTIPSTLHTMRAELIGHFEACMTEIYLHIDARMADYIRTHPYG